ncbi:MAG TPA: TatD family hydrolase [Candidatus Bathyarchaeia archaeon]|nr:TatD family hydrolase [Candidatus Bathyarchaeia archaeon]
MIDAHAHLTDRRFAADIAEVLDRARKAGVKRILTAAEDLASSEEALALAARHSDIRVAVGIHPHRASSWNVDALSRLTELARDPRVVAIGEIGMDFSGRSSETPVQEAAFRGQLALASLLNLPVVIHVRDAGDRVRAMLGEGFGIHGMVHCYSEGPDELPAWLDLGLFISFAGTVTYPGSDRLRAAAALVPVDRLLAETDAPYLAPQNARGRRNEPLYVAATHAALARERGVDIGDLAAQIAGNARMLFGERWEPS